MKIREREIIILLIEQALEFGVNHAFKHTDTPSRQSIKEHIEHELWVAINQYLILDYVVE